MADSSQPGRLSGRLPASLLRSLALLAGLAAFGLALRALGHGQFTHGAAHLSPGAFVLLGACVCAIGLPRQMVAFAAGFSHGIWLGLALAMAAQITGCAADFAWARLTGRAFVQANLPRWFGGRLSRLEALLAGNPFTATLALRLLPTGSNLLLNLLAGAFGLAPLPFLAASLLGYLPQTLVFLLLGAGIRLGHTTTLVLSLVAFGLSVTLGVMLVGRTRAAT